MSIGPCLEDWPAIPCFGDAYIRLPELIMRETGGRREGHYFLLGLRKKSAAILILRQSAERDFNSSDTSGLFSPT